MLPGAGMLGVAVYLGATMTLASYGTAPPVLTVNEWLHRGRTTANPHPERSVNNLQLVPTFIRSRQSSHAGNDL